MARFSFSQLFTRTFPSARRTAHLRVEGLEERRNPVTATLRADGVLQVDGSPAPAVNDRIQVYQIGGLISVFDARSGRSMVVPIQVAGGPVVESVNAGLVAGIEVNGGVGNDLIDLNSRFATGEDLNKPTTLSGGDGNDQIYGGQGTDSVTGGNGNDLLFGNEGNDTLFGDVGVDRLFGGNDDDELHGGAGNDTLVGAGGADALFGDDGNDTMDAGAGNDSVYGGPGNDLMDGGADNDLLYGNEGDDTLTAGPGTDVVSGGQGADTYNATPLVDTIDLGGDAQIDVVNAVAQA